MADVGGGLFFRHASVVLGVSLILVLYLGGAELLVKSQFAIAQIVTSVSVHIPPFVTWEAETLFAPNATQSIFIDTAANHLSRRAFLILLRTPAPSF